MGRRVGRLAIQRPDGTRYDSLTGEEYTGPAPTPAYEGEITEILIDERVVPPATAIHESGCSALERRLPLRVEMTRPRSQRGTRRLGSTRPITPMTIEGGRPTAAPPKNGRFWHIRCGNDAHAHHRPATHAAAGRRSAAGHPASTPGVATNRVRTRVVPDDKSISALSRQRGRRVPSRTRVCRPADRELKRQSRTLARGPPALAAALRPSVGVGPHPACAASASLYVEYGAKGLPMINTLSLWVVSGCSSSPGAIRGG